MQFLSPSPGLRANIRYLYYDMAWIGITTGTIYTFAAIYAARLGATSLQIGLLTAGPAIINLLISLPIGRWLEGHPLVHASFWSAFWSRVVFIPLIFLPWLLPAQAQTWGVVGLFLINAAPFAVLMIAFNAMFADLIPAIWRGEVMGKRNALSAITGTVALLASGLILDNLDDPYNYQVVFIIGAVGAVLSTYYVGKIRSEHEPPLVWRPKLGWEWLRRPLHPLKTILQRGWLHKQQPRTQPGRSENKSLVRWDVLRGPFGLFMGAYLVFYLSQYASISIGPVYVVNTLKLTDGAISIGNALFNVLVMLTSFNTGRLSARYASRTLTVVSGAFFGLYPLFLGLARDAGLYLAASVVGGVVWAVLNVGMINRLMERIPEDDRPAHMAIHNLVLNLGILAGSLIGPLLGDVFGLRQAMFAAVGLRALAGILLWLWG